VTPKEIHNELRKVWTNEQKLLDLLFGNYDNCNDYSMFFLKTVFVPPSRFRPESKLGDEKYLHDQTTILGRILQINFDLKMIMIQERLAEIIDKEGEKGKKGKLNDLKAMSTLAFRKSEWFNRIYKKVKTQP
jgi:DNA-directed RNA polymerase beta' subunit